MLRFSIFINILVLQSILVFGQYQELTLLVSTECSGSITDICVTGDIVYVGTENACIEAFSAKNLKLLHKIEINKIVNFMGDSINPSIYSVDEVKGKLLVVSQGKRGFSNVFIVCAGKIQQLIDTHNKQVPIKKASFISETKIILATVGNELILMDIENNSFIYRVQISPYTFSDYTLSSDKESIFTTDESGVVHQLSISNGKQITEFRGNNVDNNYQLDFKSDVIITGGRDRRVGIYVMATGLSYYLQNGFMVFAVALSGDGKYGAFMSTEDGRFSIFEILTKEIILTSKENKAPLTGLVFLNEKQILAADERKKLYLWELK